MIINQNALVYLPQYFGAQFYFDSMSMDGNGSVMSNFSSVSTQSDVSGNGHTITQGTGANRPQYRTSVINTSGNSVLYDGARYLSGSNISYAGEFTIMWLGTLDVTTAVRTIFSNGSTNGISFGAGGASFRQIIFSCNGVGTATSSANQFNAGQYAVMTAVLSNNAGNWSVDFYKNGTFIENVAMAGAPNASADPIYVGAIDASSNRWVGAHTMLAGWARVLTTWELNQMHLFFKRRAALT
jgi:hypothetical protein